VISEQAVANLTGGAAWPGSKYTDLLFWRTIFAALEQVYAKRNLASLGTREATCAALFTPPDKFHHVSISRIVFSVPFLPVSLKCIEKRLRRSFVPTSKQFLWFAKVD